MLHTNTVKKQFDVTVKLYVRRHFSKDFQTFVSGDTTLSKFTIEASSDEEANLAAGSLAEKILRNRENIERYEVTVTEKEA